jgi:hypothetical protein
MYTVACGPAVLAYASVSLPSPPPDRSILPLGHLDAVVGYWVAQPGRDFRETRMRREGLEPRTQGFKIDWFDHCPMVRDTPGYLEIPLLVTTGWCVY